MSKVSAGIQHSFMLSHLGNDVSATILVLFRNAFKCKINSLGSTAGKYDFPGPGLDTFGQKPASLFYGFFSFLPIDMVHTGSIPEFLLEIRQHGFKHL
jgi:hypothetical protein